MKPAILPSTWRQVPSPVVDSTCYLIDRLKLAVILSWKVEKDGRKWAHLSVSHKSRLPTWSELVSVKEVCFGTSTKAIQVIPPRDEYVNIHPNVLHLWTCLTEDVLPDFRSEDGGI